MIAEQILTNITEEERRRAAVVESVLPALAEAAGNADISGEFHTDHVRTLSEAGLLGLIVPTEYGGMGGSLRDLTAATVALGTACPSTALAYFFHCSSASRGLLGVEAVEAGLIAPGNADEVKAFAEKVLHRMGTEGLWLANLASESVKVSTANVAIATEATPTEGGWLLNGVKAFGCATGVADYYLVTAKLAGSDTAEGLAVFFVPRDAEGVAERPAWDGLGMRATANHGITLKDVFIPSDEALTVPGAFVAMMQCSRGTFVGNQIAGTAVYLGAAMSVYNYAIDFLKTRTYADTGRPIGESGFHQVLIGEMTTDLETARLWITRQLELETSDPPLLPKDEVVKQWRMSKGSIAEACFRVGVNALKACGTGNTINSGVIARGLRDLAMGLVQAFPAEKGKLDAASMVISGTGETALGVR